MSLTLCCAPRLFSQPQKTRTKAPDYRTPDYRRPGGSGGGGSGGGGGPRRMGRVGGTGGGESRRRCGFCVGSVCGGGALREARAVCRPRRPAVRPGIACAPHSMVFISHRSLYPFPWQPRPRRPWVVDEDGKMITRCLATQLVVPLVVGQPGRPLCPACATLPSFRFSFPPSLPVPLAKRPATRALLCETPTP